jgi:general secretion pathway protein B
MSYILDALKKADAERESGEIPNIYSSDSTLLPPGGAASSAFRLRPVIWGCAATVVLMIMVFGMNWAMRSGDAPARAAAVPAVVVPTPSPPVEATTASAVQAPVVVASTTVVDIFNGDAKASQAAQRVASAAAALALPVPPEAVDKLVSVRTLSAKFTPSLPRSAALAASTVASTAASDAASSAVLTLAELPEEIRRELPTTQVGGAMYSDLASNRVLIINGQALHEGEDVAPGLTLTQIKLKAAVLTYKGFRYSITY